MKKKIILRRLLPVLSVFALMICLLPAVPAFAAKSSAPTVTLAGDQIQITYSGSDVSTWVVYVDGELTATASYAGSSTWVDLPDLISGIGTFSISVAGAVGQTLVTEESTAVTYDHYSISYGSWQCFTSVMSGEYQAPAAWPGGLGTVSVAFSTSNTSFSRMSYGYWWVSGDYYLFYDDVPVYCFGKTVKEAGWLSDSYATIFFDSDQTVDQAFYGWFTSSFTRISSSQVISEVSTIFKIYDSSGFVLLDTISFSGSTAPTVTLTRSDSCVYFTAGSQTVSWATDDDFVGFGLSSGFADILTDISGDDASFQFSGGAYADQVITLYVAAETHVVASASDFLGFTSFIVVVLGGFLSFEIAPGLSFGGMFSFFVVVGVALFLIKVFS